MTAQTWVARLAPATLRQQILLLAALVIAASTVAYGYFSEQQVAGRVREGLMREASALARTIASSNAQYLVVNDLTSVEQALLSVAKFPGILRLTVVRLDGDSVADVTVRAGGDAQPIYSRSKLKVPDTVAPQAQARSEDGALQIVAWEPIGESRPLGWARVSLSLQAEAEARAASRRQTLGAVSVVILLTLAALYYFLRRALLPLEAAARFASELPSNFGSRLEGVASSAELTDLQASLNAASAQLAQQHAAIREGQAALTESLARFQAVFEASLDCIISTDAQDRIIEFNPAAERTFGVTAKDVLGKDLAEVLIPPASRAAHRAGMRHFLRTGHGPIMGKRIEVEAQRADGSLFPAELTVVKAESARGRTFTAHLRDLTERKRAEADIAMHTQRLNAIFALSPDGFVAFDGAGRLSYVNPAFTRMTGLSADSLRGMSVEAFDAKLMTLCDPNAPYEAAPIGGADVTGTLSAASVRARATLKLVSPELRYLQRRVRAGRGEAGGQVLYFRDVTRETEVDRMKTEFLSTAAHELRTPMASILGFTELMLKREFDAATRRDLLDTVNRQAKILTNLVNELLDLARIEARGGKDFRIRGQPLRPVIETTLGGLIVPGDERKVSLVLPEALPPVAIDAEKVHQALLNVVSNAYKYSPNGGAIVLSASTRQNDQRTEVGVTVTDRGIGMTPEQSARAFERFYRADASGKIPGTGLGLALVKEIVEIHGGHVELRSALGEGTAVTLWLPMATGAAPDS